MTEFGIPGLQRPHGAPKFDERVYADGYGTVDIVVYGPVDSRIPTPSFEAFIADETDHQVYEIVFESDNGLYMIREDIGDGLVQYRLFINYKDEHEAYNPHQHSGHHGGHHRDHGGEPHHHHPHHHHHYQHGFHGHDESLHHGEMHHGLPLGSYKLTVCVNKKPVKQLWIIYKDGVKFGQITQAELDYRAAMALRPKGRLNCAYSYEQVQFEAVGLPSK